MGRLFFIMTSIETQNKDLPENVVRRKIITIREETETRRAIQITIEQKVNNNLVRILPTMHIIGHIPRVIESPRFAKEFAEGLIHGAMTMMEWS